MTSKFLTILENIKSLEESGDMSEKVDKSNTEENLLLIP